MSGVKPPEPEEKRKCGFTLFHILVYTVHVILYFSGTGNSRYTAERLGAILKDELFSINDALKKGIRGNLRVNGRLVIVTPTYCWRIPRIVSSWIMKSSFCGTEDVYFVMTCGDTICNAAEYNRKLSRKKGFVYRGTVKLIMPENYIALFDSPSPEEARRIVATAEKRIEKIASVIEKNGEFRDGSVTLRKRVLSGPVNPLFYRFIVKAAPFRAGKNCPGCGRCAAVCPMGNITIGDTGPVWGRKCTHCMACISYCPEKCIEYGRKSIGKTRYTIETVKKEGSI